MVDGDKILASYRAKYQWVDDEWASWAIPKIVEARLSEELRSEQDSAPYWGA